MNNNSDFIVVISQRKPLCAAIHISQICPHWRIKLEAKAGVDPEELQPHFDRISKYK